MATEIQPSMRMAEMTDDMQMITTWGVLRGYRERIKHLEDVLQYIAGSETPHANSTVKAMAKVARTALPPRAALKQD